jgi:hypothetical protein
MRSTNLKLQKITSHFCSDVHSKNGIILKVRTILTLTILLSIAVFAQDQIKKGTYALNGSIGYSSIVSNQSSFKYDESDFFFSPSISYFVIDNLELALSPSYSKYSLTDQSNSSGGFSGKNLGIGLGIRYYFSGNNISPFIGANAQSNWYASDGNSYSSPHSSGTLEGGLDVFISNALAVEPAVSYFSERLGDQYTLSGFRIGIGVKYFIVP